MASGKIMRIQVHAPEDDLVRHIGYHLVFEVDLAIMNGAAVNDDTIDHCTPKCRPGCIQLARRRLGHQPHIEIIDLEG